MYGNIDGYCLSGMAVECLWVKGVADYGKSGKGNAYHKLASYASAMFLYKLIKENL